MILEPSFLAAGQESKRNIKNLSFLVIIHTPQGNEASGACGIFYRVVFLKSDGFMPVWFLNLAEK